jgi:hypothetical protein
MNLYFSHISPKNRSRITGQIDAGSLLSALIQTDSLQKQRERGSNRSFHNETGQNLQFNN